MGIIEILLTLIVIIAIAYAAFWIIDSSMPEPIRWLAKLLVGVIALIVLLLMLKGGTGFNIHL